jgi:hypothetical protein
MLFWYKGASSDAAGEQCEQCAAVLLHLDELLTYADVYWRMQTYADVC